MSALTGDSGGGGENEDVLAEELAREQDLRQSDLEEEGRTELSVAAANNLQGADDPSFTSDELDLEQNNCNDCPEVIEPSYPASLNGSLSIPDDTPSVQGSLLSSPGSSVPASRATPSRTTSGSLQPFDRRFQSRLSSSPLQSPRNLSPAFLSPGSRQSSLSSTLTGIGGDGGAEADTPQAPWEVVRWSRLKKVTGQIFSEVGKRNFGRPTCLAVAASLVIGTSKGYILAFDYQQTLKIIIGSGTQGNAPYTHCWEANS